MGVLMGLILSGMLLYGVFRYISVAAFRKTMNNEPGDGASVFKAADQLGLEGILSKRLGSLQERSELLSGARWPSVQRLAHKPVQQ